MSDVFADHDAVQNTRFFNLAARNLNNGLKRPIVQEYLFDTRITLNVNFALAVNVHCDGFHSLECKPEKIIECTQRPYMHIRSLQRLTNFVPMVDLIKLIIADSSLTSTGTLISSKTRTASSRARLKPWIMTIGWILRSKYGRAFARTSPAAH